MNNKLFYLFIILIFCSCTGRRIFWTPPSNPTERNEKNKDKMKSRLKMAEDKLPK